MELHGAFLLTISSLGAIVSYEANLVQDFSNFSGIGFGKTDRKAAMTLKLICLTSQKNASDKDASVQHTLLSTRLNVEGIASRAPS